MTGRPPRQSLASRITSKVDHVDGCWLWRGSFGSNGYGLVWRDGRMVLAHRAAYETWCRPLVEGETVDHLCGNARCVNPEHLEAVSQSENTFRSRRAAMARRRQ